MRDSRKLAMQFNDSRHACSNSFLEAVIVAAMIAFAVCVYVDLILQVAFVPNHSGNSSCDEFDRLVLRLDNRFAFDAILGHDLTSNEIAVFDRISIVAGRL